MKISLRPSIPDVRKYLDSAIQIFAICTILVVLVIVAAAQPPEKEKNSFGMTVLRKSPLGTWIYKVEDASGTCFVAENKPDGARMQSIAISCFKR